MKYKPDPGELSKLKSLLGALKKVKMSDAAKARFYRRMDEIDIRRRETPAPSFGHGIITHIKEVYAALRSSQLRPGLVYAYATALSVFVIASGAYSFMPLYPCVESLRGTVKVYDAGRNVWYFAKAHQKLKTDDIVKTFSDASADISFKDKYTVRLKPDSELKIGSIPSRAISRDIKFFVPQGKVYAFYAGSMERKAGSATLNIETNEAVVSALGTEFMVQSMPVINRTWVGVLEGEVKVTGAGLGLTGGGTGRAVFVKETYKTTVSKGEVPDRPQLMTNDEWLDMRELYSIGRKPQVALLISNRSSRARELLKELPLYISDTEPSSLSGKLKEADKLFRQAVSKDSAEKHLRTIALFEDIVRRHPNPAYNVQFLLFIGSYYARIEKYEEAIATFQKVIDRYPDSRLASLAACAMGIIYEEKLRDAENAKESYRRVISRYPMSLEAEEARAGLERLSK